MVTKFKFLSIKVPRYLNLLTISTLRLPIEIGVGVCVALSFPWTNPLVSLNQLYSVQESWI